MKAKRKKELKHTIDSGRTIINHRGEEKPRSWRSYSRIWKEIEKGNIGLDEIGNLVKLDKERLRALYNQYNELRKSNPELKEEIKSLGWNITNVKGRIKFYTDSYRILKRREKDNTGYSIILEFDSSEHKITVNEPNRIKEYFPVYTEDGNLALYDDEGNMFEYVRQYSMDRIIEHNAEAEAMTPPPPSSNKELYRSWKYYDRI